MACSRPETAKPGALRHQFTNPMAQDEQHWQQLQHATAKLCLTPLAQDQLESHQGAQTRTFIKKTYSCLL